MSLPDGFAEEGLVACKVYNGASIVYKSTCFIAHFVSNLYVYKFGYICMGLTFLIILISIFGGIKENYRWYILNQAIWDLCFSYNYTCSSKVITLVYKNPKDFCLYSSSVVNGFFDALFVSNPYSALLLLTCTRYIALYFMSLNQRLNKKSTVFFLILIFNLISCLLHLYTLFDQLRGNRTLYLFEQCKLQPKSLFCSSENDSEYNTYIKLTNIFYPFHYFKKLASLILTTIFAVLIVYKIGTNAKFQLKHNRKEFLKSARISAVIILQTFFTIILFFADFIKTIKYIVTDILGYKEWDYTSATCEGCIEFGFPSWIDDSWGLTDARSLEAARQIRVFIDSFIVLFLMAGYRESIVSFLKVIFYFLRHPSKSYLHIKKGIYQTAVTIISTAAP